MRVTIRATSQNAAPFPARPTIATNAARQRRREEELQLRVGERERRIGAADQPPLRDEEREPKGGERRHRGEGPRISRPRQDGADAARLAAGAIDEENEVQDRNGDRDQIAR